MSAIAEPDSKVDDRSVINEMARTAGARAVSPRLCANSHEPRMTAAAPQVGAQHCRREMGAHTMLDPMTSSALTCSRNTATGLCSA
jgi:hypothetical protein